MDNRGIYTSLKTGKRVYLRPVRAHDSARLRESIENLSDQSRYFRFFSGMRTVPDAVLDRLLAVDGIDHLAWAALDLAEHDLPAIGVVRVIRDPKSGVAELAIATLDAFHNTGLARILMATIAQDCLHAGFQTLVANVLAENKKARSLFVALGGTCTHSEGAYMTFTFDVSLMDVRLRAMDGLSGLAEVYAAFGRFDLSAPRLAS